jgi:hypothetical protein
MTDTQAWKNIFFVLLGMALIIFLLFLYGSRTIINRFNSITAADCLPGEIFDEEDSWCYWEPDCDTDEECAEIEDAYNAALDKIFDNYGGDFSELYAWQDVFASYNVSGGDFAPLDRDLNRFPDLDARDESTEQHEELWDLFSSFFPPVVLEHISRMEVFTDGIDGTLAYVDLDYEDRDLDQWVVSLDALDTYKNDGQFYDVELVLPTFIHEVAHIVTLNNTQLDYSTSAVSVVDDDAFVEESEKQERACTQYYALEGCTNSDSYLNDFVNAFWDDELITEMEDLISSSEVDLNEDPASELYLQYPDYFLTAYAPTGPEEDIAESMTLFVIGPKSDGGTIADQKLNFFYNYPELVQFRRIVRNGVLEALAR